MGLPLSRVAFSSSVTKSPLCLPKKDPLHSGPPWVLRDHLLISRSSFSHICEVPLVTWTSIRGFWASGPGTFEPSFSPTPMFRGTWRAPLILSRGSEPSACSPTVGTSILTPSECALSPIVCRALSPRSGTQSFTHLFKRCPAQQTLPEGQCFPGTWRHWQHLATSGRKRPAPPSGPPSIRDGG